MRNSMIAVFFAPGVALSLVAVQRQVGVADRTAEILDRHPSRIGAGGRRLEGTLD
jgi:hypothetical protein